MYFSYVWLLTNGCFFLMFISSKYSLSSLLFTPSPFPQVEVKRALPRDDSNPMAHQRTKKVFLGGLSPDTVREEIQDVLEQYGKVCTFLSWVFIFSEICRMDVVGIIWNLLARNTLVSSPDPTLSQGETVW